MANITTQHNTSKQNSIFNLIGTCLLSTKPRGTASTGLAEIHRAVMGMIFFFFPPTGREQNHEFTLEMEYTAG